jgi:hypothetical protein
MVANMRLNPADSVASALDYLKKVVDDENVEITALESFEPAASPAPTAKVGTRYPPPYPKPGPAASFPPT